MSGVVLPFKAPARRWTMSSKHPSEDSGELLDLIFDAKIALGQIDKADRRKHNAAIDAASAAWDAAAEALLAFEAKWDSVNRKWARAASREVVRGFVQEKRGQLREIKSCLCDCERLPEFKPVALPHLVAPSANTNTRTRRTKKEGLPMGRPLSPKLVLRGDHYAFRCVVKDGGRPWVPLPAGLTLAEAQATALVIAQRASAGLYSVNAGPKKTIAHVVTFAEWCGRWIESREERGLFTTKDDLSRLRTHVFPTLGPKPVAKITKAQIEDLVSELDGKVYASKLSAKTAKNVWGVVRKAFTDAHKAKERGLRVRGDNPCADLDGPYKGKPKVKAFMYPNEVHALLSCDAVPLVFRRAAALAIYLGLRSGELRSLRWDDVDIEHGTVHVHQGFDRRKHKAKSTKTGRSRRFDFEEAVRPLLVALHAEAGGKGPVIQIPRFFNLARDLRKHLRTANVKRHDLHNGDATRKQLTFHDLRSTCLTFMAVRGDPTLTIAARAGHSTSKQTEEYVKTAGELNRSRFGEIFAPLPTVLLASNDQADGQNTDDMTQKQAENTRVTGGLRTRDT